MAFLTKCSQCGLNYNLADGLRGKRLRCKQCRAEFVAQEGPAKAAAPASRVSRPETKAEPAEAAPPRREPEKDRPQRRARPTRAEKKADETPPPPRKSSGGKIGWIIGGSIGGVGLLFLACCGSCIAWPLMFGKFTTNTGPLVQAPTSPAPAGPGPQNPITPGPQNPAPPAPAAWTVKADPTPLPPVKVANPDKRATLTADFPYILGTPSTPSPFVSSGLNDFPQHKQEIWNLETMEKVGEVKGLKLGTKGVLSPDGEHLAGQRNDGNQAFVVVSCRDGKQAFEVDERPLFPTEFYDFAGPRQFIIGSIAGGFRHAYHIYEVPGGRKLREVEAARDYDKGSEAISPGGKYLALRSGPDAVRFYDLEQGEPAGQFTIPDCPANPDNRVLAFSADGKDLAVYFETRNRLRILTWDLEGNKPGVDYTLPPSALRGLKTGPKYWGRPLEWLGDGSGFLIRGELVIDRKNGQPLWRLDVGGTSTDYLRHVVGSTHVARLYGEFAKDGLGLVEIRRGQIDPVKPDPDPNGGKPPIGPKPTPLVKWQDGQPDPLPADLALPEKAEGNIPITGYPPSPNNVVDQAVFPTTPSPFVTVATRGKITDAHELWDLRTMKKVGVAVEPEHPFTRGHLSPDGAYFAVPTFLLNPPHGVEVYSTADGKRVKRITVSSDRNRSCDNIDFAGPGQLLTLIYGTDKVGGAGVLVALWDIKSGMEVRHFEADAEIDRNQRALSPGRRYLALVSLHENRLLLYDLTTGTLAGELPVPAGAKCFGLSFAADGKSLAGLFKVDNTNRLLVWKVESGQASAQFTLDGEAVPKVTVYQGPTLEWVADGGGWLISGQRIVDRESGRYYWPVPAQDGDWTPRHILPDSRLVYLGSERGKRFLMIVPLQKEKMEEALKRVRSRP